MPKQPLTPEKTAKLLAELRSYDNPSGQIAVFRKGAKCSRGGDIFVNQLPAVKERAIKWLAILMERHKEKLAVKGKKNYYGILCGIAIRMAKADLGLIITPKEAFRKAFHLSKRKSSIRTQLGLQPPQHDPNYKRSEHAP